MVWGTTTLGTVSTNCQLKVPGTITFDPSAPAQSHTATVQPEANFVSVANTTGVIANLTALTTAPSRNVEWTVIDTKNQEWEFDKTIPVKLVEKSRLTLGAPITNPTPNATLAETQMVGQQPRLIGSGCTTLSSSNQRRASLALGGNHTCVIDTKEQLWCWGYNNYGQLGINSQTSSSTLKLVSSFNRPQQVVAAGTYQTCAIDIDRQLSCWGYCANGQIGNVGSCTGSSCTTTNPNCRSTPVNLTAVPNAVAVATGSSHTCAVNNSNQLFCWGSNNYRQLGNATLVTYSDYPNPQRVTALSNVVAVAAGYYHTCAVTNSSGSGYVDCWGNNTSGQIGNSTTNSPVTDPYRISVLSGKAVAVAAGAGHTCALNNEGRIWCWGNNAQGQIGNSVVSPTSTTYVLTLYEIPTSGLRNRAVAIAAGGYHTCALSDDGKVWCWGRNNEGQLGLGDNVTPRTSPSSIPYFNNNAAVAIAAGSNHTCAITENNELLCWGSNSNGQLGVSGVTTSHTPLPICISSGCLGTGITFSGVPVQKSTELQLGP